MPPREVMREVQAWIGKAENDLKNIELVLPYEDAPLDTVCFHAQQAAEKYLKALLTFLGTAFPKTHDIPELLLLLPEDSQVPSSVGDMSDVADAAVGVRYPGDPEEYDRGVAEELVSKAKIVKAAVLAELARLDYEG
jgi:HEPN domain-containing protein